MRSSGSTPSRSPEPNFPLYLLLAAEDHPRQCTGRRLVAHAKVFALGADAARRRRGVLLDPHASTPLSNADRDRARDGIVAVDCSWNRLALRGRYPSEPGRPAAAGSRRRLPYLLAGNPQHYGRLGELNTAEALASALFVLGAPSAARELLGAAGVSDSVLSLNRSALEDYREAPDAAEVERIEREYF